jgi:hypothetical protein
VLTLVVDDDPVAAEIAWSRSDQEDGASHAIVTVSPAEDLHPRLTARLARPGNLVEPVGILSLPGAGMHRVQLMRRSSGSFEMGALPRWSRTAGALGDNAWRRLTSLSFGVVGCGRLGSVMAMSLAQGGVRNLTLVDPDLVELHNLGEMDGVVDGDVGVPKVDAVASTCRRRFKWTNVRALAAPVMQWSARAALKDCDVIVSCSDTDGGRLGTATIASAYLKVLVDVGTGVFSDPHSPRTRGAEIRLVVPGDGCLMCLGGISNLGTGIRQLASMDAAGGNPLATSWTAERAGSLRSVNLVAAGLALDALEALVCEEEDRSTWRRVEMSARDGPHLRLLARQASSPGCLCREQGVGDQAAGGFSQLLQD